MGLFSFIFNAAFKLILPIVLLAAVIITVILAMEFTAVLIVIGVLLLAVFKAVLKI